MTMLWLRVEKRRQSWFQTRSESMEIRSLRISKSNKIRKLSPSKLAILPTSHHAFLMPPKVVFGNADNLMQSGHRTIPIWLEFLPQAWVLKPTKTCKYQDLCPKFGWRMVLSRVRLENNHREQWDTISTKKWISSRVCLAIAQTTI